MRQKVTIALSIILLLVVGIITYFNTTTQPDVEKIDVDTFFEVPKLEEENLSKLMLPVQEEFNNAITLDEPKKLLEEEIEEFVEIYQEVDKEELLQKLATKKLVAPVAGIQFQKSAIANLFMGDKIKLPNVGQVAYSAEITKRVEHKNGSVSVTGNLIGDNNAKYSVILTEGKTNSYASITTPEGAFEIETINGVGYIYSVKDIEEKYIDPTKEDVLIPNHDGHKH
jgi:hypothetical protein